MACRTDESWRKSLLSIGLVKNSDFDCDHGVTSATAFAEQANALSNLGQYAALNGIGKKVRQAKGTCCGQSSDEEPVVE